VPLLALIGMTVTALGVFAAAQSPCLLRSDLTALGVSVVVTGALGSGTIALGWRTAPLPLFALLLAVHTMMPISNTVSLLMAAVLTTVHIALAISWRPDTPSFYPQVRFFMRSSCLNRVSLIITLLPNQCTIYIMCRYN